MDERAELEELRRLEELEAKAANAPPPDPTMTDVMKQAPMRGLANLLNTPIALKDLLLSGIANLPYMGHLKGAQEAITPDVEPNYAMKAMEQVGVLDPNKYPVTPQQRIMDAAIQGGTGAALTGGVGSLPAMARSAAVGATSAGAGKAVEEVTGSPGLGIATSVATGLALGKLQPEKFRGGMNDVNKATLKDAQQAGYVVPPSRVKSSFSQDKLESVGGKAMIEQEAAVRNQAVTNQLAAKSLGLPPDTQLTADTLKQVRDAASVPYQEVEKLRASATNLPWFPRYHSPNLLEEMKQARADSKSLFLSAYRTGDPKILEQAKAASSLANSIEGDIEMIAKAAGQPQLVSQLKQARTLIARSYDVEAALNEGAGNVSATVIAKLMDQGKPLSKELKTIARFAQAFPRSARETSMVPSSTVSGTDAFATSALGMGGYGAGGPAAAVVGAGLPLLRGPARNYLLSKGVQSRLLAEPNAAQTVGRAAGGTVSLLQDYRESLED